MVYGNDLILDRLTQGFEYCMAELRKLAQEQYAPVAERHLYKPERAATADWASVGRQCGTCDMEYAGVCFNLDMMDWQ